MYADPKRRVTEAMTLEVRVPGAITVESGDGDFDRRCAPGAADVDEPTIADRVVGARAAFDAVFAAAPPLAGAPLEDFLAIRVGGTPYLIRLAECAGLARARKVVALPSRSIGLLGIAAVRGAVVPVFSLATLLGHAATREAPPWLVLCGPSTDVVALGVASLEATLKLSPADIHATVESATRHASVVATTPAGARPVISIASVLAALRTRATSGP